MNDALRVPCKASNVEELGCGAILKHMVEDLRAVVIDMVGISQHCVAVVVDGDKLDEKYGNKFKPKYYKTQVINLDEWIALTTGSEEWLIE